MKKFWKAILAIGGAIVGILALFAVTKQSQSKKNFKKKVKENEDKIDEEIKKELNEVLEKLREAHKSEDVNLVNQHTEELNSLWTKASQQMYKNMKDDNVEMPTGSEQTQDAEFEEVK